MLKCLIAFVLGFLVARMMRGNGMSVGGGYFMCDGCYCTKWDDTVGGHIEYGAKCVNGKECECDHPSDRVGEYVP